MIAFEGWNDAGEAASGAADHLNESLSATPFAWIDPEDFFVFTETRPRVEITPTGARRVVWPRTELSHAKLPGTDRDLIVVRGTEPQLRWRTFCDLIVSVAKRFDARAVVTMGALLADVPHTRPTIVYGTSDDAELSEALDLSPSTYEGPTGIVGVLHSACSTAGLVSASLWAAVPTYVPGTTSPKATLALTNRLATIIDCVFDTRVLSDEADEYEQQITEFVSDDVETLSWVAELEQHYDDDQADTSDSERPEPQIDGSASPEKLVQEVEQFLRDQS